MINRNNLKISNIPIMGPEDRRRDCWAVVLALGHHTPEEGVHPRRGDEEAKGF